MNRLLIIISLTLLISNVSAQNKFGSGAETGIMRAKNSKKYEFKVTYLNGETKTVTSSMDIDFCARTLMLNDENIESEEESGIYPPETKYIERVFKDGSTMKGIPTDSLWLFPVYEGKLNAYSTLPHKKVKDIEFLEKGDVSMSVSENALYNVFADNDLATEYFEKSLNRKRWAKRMGFWVAPVVVIGLFTAEDFGYDFNPVIDKDGDGERDNQALSVSYLHFGAVGMIGASFIFKNSSKKNLERAFETYNQ